MTWTALGEYRGPNSVRAFIRYAESRCESDTRQEIFRVYVTDCLQAVVSANTRYYDLVNPREDYRPDEIIEAVIAHAGLEVIDNESA